MSVTGVTAPGTAITDVLNSLLNLTYARLSEKPKLVSLAPGTAVAIDDCCDGQLWARVAGVSPMLLTKQVTPNMGCQVGGWRVSAAIGTARCVHGLRDGGYFPTNVQMGIDFDLIMLDMEALSSALICDFSQLPAVSALSLGRWTPHGPESMCAGGEWVFDFTMPYCGCPSTDTAPLGAARIGVSPDA